MNKNILPEIINLHHNAIIVDAHCDTILDVIRKKRSLGEKSDQGHLDLERMRKGGTNVQFFAAFIEPLYKNRGLYRAIQLIDCLYQEIENNSSVIKIATNFSQILETVDQGMIAGIISIEGGEALEGDLASLRMLYRLGVRSITLTWNGRNELADGVGEEGTSGGLTRFGIEVVKEMNKLGMIVDVSHLSEAGFWDVIKVSSMPIIASHSNCYSLCSHPRNLNDEQIKAIALNQGAIGITFAPDFVDSNNATLSKVLDHIDYLVEKAGIDYVGLGSDFDGINQTPKDLNDVTELINITEGLSRRGYKENDIKKIIGQNFLRVIKNVLG